MKKYLDSNGLSKVWAKVKNYVSTEIGKLSTSFAAATHQHSKGDISDLVDATDAKGGLMTDTQAAKLAGIAQGAQVNVIEKINVNGTAQSVGEGKSVEITVPTSLLGLDNTQTKFQSEDEMDGKIAAALSSTYKAGPSKTASELTDALLVKANLGYVYNVKEGFTTTDSFVEGSGKKYPAGTNVAIVEEGSGVYKFDVQSGFINVDDLESEALSEEDINAILV